MGSYEAAKDVLSRSAEASRRNGGGDGAMIETRPKRRPVIPHGWGGNITTTRSPLAKILNHVLMRA